MTQTKIPAEYLKIESYDVQYLPIIRAYLEKIKVKEIIDKALSCEMQYSPGRIVVAMILDVLTGRSPLFRLYEFLEHQDIELVIGEHLPIAAFNDNNIGRILDRMFEYGTQKLFFEISLVATRTFNVDTKYVREDTTSRNVWGEYKDSEESEGITVTYGHSKDHRPDLKQFMFSMLSVEKNIPIPTLTFFA